MRKKGQTIRFFFPSIKAFKGRKVLKGAGQKYTQTFQLNCGTFLSVDSRKHQSAIDGTFETTNINAHKHTH